MATLRITVTDPTIDDLALLVELCDRLGITDDNPAAIGNDFGTRVVSVEVPTDVVHVPDPPDQG